MTGRADRRGALVAAAIAVCGTAATIAASLRFNMSASEAASLAVRAGGAALVAGVAGAAVLLVLRRRSTTVQMTVVAVVCVAAVGAGALAASRAMFLSQHDLDTLLVVLLPAGTVGALVAFVLGRRVVTGTLSLRAAVRRIGSGGEDADAVASRPSTAEQAALAEELDRMTARLEEARGRELALDSSRRELIAWVSHDLRTPLAGIRAIAEALEDGVVADPETVSRYYRTLRREADRLSGLVDDLFELSVIQAGALRLQMERVSLGDLVSDAIAAAAVGAEAKGVHLEGSVPGPAPEVVLSAPEVSRVLRNLLENAIRHTPSDGTVWVEAGLGSGEDEAYVAVADQCGGIAPEHLDRVFDTAYRAEPARTPRPDGGAGAGLGLAIARGIVEAHDGRIAVENQNGGCRFTLRLPIAPPNR